MKKILLLLLLFSNLQFFIDDDGCFSLHSFTMVMAQHMTTESGSSGSSGYEITGVLYSYECPYCYEKFYNENQLNKHKKECYPYECDACFSKFHTSEELINHYPNCPEANRICRYCLALFASAEERSAHETSCSYKTPDGGSNLGTTAIPTGYHCAFECLPKDMWVCNDLDLLLSSLAYIEYAQPKHKHSAAEIKTFKEKCLKFRFNTILDLTRIPGKPFTIGMYGNSFNVYECENSQWASQYASVPTATIFFNGRKLVSSCIIGYNDDGDFITLLGSSQNLTGLLAFQVSPASLMWIVMDTKIVDS